MGEFILVPKREKEGANYQILKHPELSLSRLFPRFATKPVIVFNFLNDLEIIILDD